MNNYKYTIKMLIKEFRNYERRDFMETYDCIVSRRSIRAYTNQQIKIEDLDKILEAGRYAPSGMNSQSCRFTAIQNQNTLSMINSSMKEALLDYVVDENTHPYMSYLINQAKEDNVNFFYNAKTLIIVSNEKNNPTANPDAALTLGNMMLMAHDLGLGSVWLNQLVIIKDLAKVRSAMERIHIPENHEIFGSLVVGYSSTNPLEATKRKMEVKVIL